MQGVGDRDVRKGTNGKVVELHHVPNEHSDGMLVVFPPPEEPVERRGHPIPTPPPRQKGGTKKAAATLDRLKLDYATWLPAHPPNPDRPLTKDDVAKAVGAGQ